VNQERAVLNTTPVWTFCFAEDETNYTSTSLTLVAAAGVKVHCIVPKAGSLSLCIYCILKLTKEEFIYDHRPIDNILDIIPIQLTCIYHYPPSVL
jgi:hypothetical protein